MVTESSVSSEYESSTEDIDQLPPPLLTKDSIGAQTVNTGTNVKVFKFDSNTVTSKSQSTTKKLLYADLL